MQPLRRLQPGPSISRRPGALQPFSCGLTDTSPALRKAQLEGSWQQSKINSSLLPPRSSTSRGPTEPGGVMEVEPSPVPAPSHISSLGQDHHRLPISAERSRAPQLQSPPLTQICLKGSGAVAPSLQARFGRFQGTASQCSKLAAKNGTPLWQGDMLLVLTGGQGTSTTSSFRRGFGQITRARGLHCRHVSQPTTERRPTATTQAQPRLLARVDAPAPRAAGAAPSKHIHPPAPRHPTASEQGPGSPGPPLDQLRQLDKATQASRHARMGFSCFSQAFPAALSNRHHLFPTARLH